MGVNRHERKQWLQTIIVIVIVVSALATQSSISGKLNFQEHKWWLLFIATIIGIAVIRWLIERKKKVAK